MKYRAAFIIPALLAGCALLPQKSPEVAQTPQKLWENKNKPKVQAKPSSYVIPDEVRNKKWGLPDVLDIALKNNPVTSSAWLDARSARARALASDSGYYPKVWVSASGTMREVNDTTKETLYNVMSTGGAINLSWLAWDFGSRDYQAQSARLGVVVANLNQNRAIQDSVLVTSKAYYQYLAAKALRETRQKSLERAQTFLKAAEVRHEAGVATLSDVLQAKTAVSRADYDLQSAKGAIEITRGTLAVAMGYPANIDFDIEELPQDIAYDQVKESVDKLIGDALELRPEVAQAQAQVAMNEALAKKARTDGLPTVTLTAGAGPTWTNYYNLAGNGGVDKREDVLSVGVALNFPIFNGYYDTYNHERAVLDTESAKERAKLVEQQIIYQVFSAYQSMVTASSKVRTSDDFVKSAELSEEMALGRYKEGVGNILDLLTAQATLVDARVQGIAARWEWRTSLSQLAHDTGLLGLNGETSLKP